MMAPFKGLGDSVKRKWKKVSHNHALCICVYECGCVAKNLLLKRQWSDGMGAGPDILCHSQSHQSTY